MAISAAGQLKTAGPFPFLDIDTRDLQLYNVISYSPVSGFSKELAGQEYGEVWSAARADIAGYYAEGVSKVFGFDLLPYIANTAAIKGSAVDLTVEPSAGDGSASADWVLVTIGAENVDLIGELASEEPTNVSAYLNLKVKGLRRNFGLSGDETEDATVKIVNAIAECSAAGRTLEVEEGVFRYTSTLFATSFQGFPTIIIGSGGPERSILYHDPAAYSLLSWAFWFGNMTSNVPSAIYQCYRPEMHDLRIECSGNSRGGLRVREARNANLSNIVIKPRSGQTLGSAVNKYVGLLVDGSINSKYSLIESAPGNGNGNGVPLTIAGQFCQSLDLQAQAGSGSGASITTTSFSELYLHYASDIANLNGMNASPFNTCIFEAGHRGVTIEGANFPAEFNNCYWEGLTQYPIRLRGIDATSRASAIVRGGEYQSNDKIGDVANPTKAFIAAEYGGKITIDDLLVVGNNPQEALIVSTNSTKISMNAYANEFVTEPSAAVTTNSGDVTTVAGSQEITFTENGHGLSVGDVVGIKNYSTPQDTLRINRPFYRVTAIPDANNFTVANMQANFWTANASSTVNTPGGEIVRYPRFSWLTTTITEPSKTTLADCRTESILFSETFSAGGAATRLQVGGEGIRRYCVDDWTYIMTVQKERSVTGGAQSGAYIMLDYPNGYEQNLNFGDAGAFLSNGLYGAVVDIGFKVPPGTYIAFEIAPGIASTLQARIVLARTGIS